jgi:hypothetical protein
VNGKKKKIEETGVSGSKGPESPASSSCPESPPPKAGVSGPTHNDFAGKYNPHYVFLGIIMVMSMLDMLVPMMVTLNMLFGYLRFL